MGREEDFILAPLGFVFDVVVLASLLESETTTTAGGGREEEGLNGGSKGGGRGCSGSSAARSGRGGSGSSNAAENEVQVRRGGEQGRQRPQRSHPGNEAREQEVAGREWRCWC